MLAAHIRKPNTAAALSHPSSVYAAFCCGILAAARNRYTCDRLNPGAGVLVGMQGERRGHGVLTQVVQIHHLLFSKILLFRTAVGEQTKAISLNPQHFARLRARTYTGDRGESQVR